MQNHHSTSFARRVQDMQAVRCMPDLHAEFMVNEQHPVDDAISAFEIDEGHVEGPNYRNPSTQTFHDDVEPYVSVSTLPHSTTTALSPVTLPARASSSQPQAKYPCDRDSCNMHPQDTILGGRLNAYLTSRDSVPPIQNPDNTITTRDSETSSDSQANCLTLAAHVYASPQCLSWRRVVDRVDTGFARAVSALRHPYMSVRRRSSVLARY